MPDSTTPQPITTATANTGQTTAASPATTAQAGTVSPAVSASPLVAKAPVTQKASVATTASSVPANPMLFGVDQRYIILMADGLIVTGLIIALAIRLINRALVSQETVAPGSQEHKPAGGGPKTLDDLNVDIPV